MSIENIEMNKQRKSLDKDVKKLVDKYIRIMDWGIPDINEAKARQLVIDEIKLVVSLIEKQQE